MQSKKAKIRAKGTCKARQKARIEKFMIFINQKVNQKLFCIYYTIIYNFYSQKVKTELLICGNLFIKLMLNTCTRMPYYPLIKFINSTAIVPRTL